MKLTEQEKKTIAALKRIAKNFPNTLWLFSASGTLCVMKKDEDGNIPTTEFGGIDQNYVVDTINIENDGGDW